MTIGELLDLMDEMPASATFEDWQAMGKPLGVILSNAAAHYDRYDDPTSEFALSLGLYAIRGTFGIDKDRAADSPVPC